MPTNPLNSAVDSLSPSNRTKSRLALLGAALAGCFAGFFLGVGKFDWALVEFGFCGALLAFHVNLRFNP